MINVSVIIPTKNRSSTIKRALNSVFKQTIKDIEIIIIDDGSTDNTKSIINKYQKESQAPLKYYKNDVSVGGAVARNQGSKLSSGRYIAFLDSDDEWLPNHLFTSLELIKSNNSSGVYGSFYTQKKGEGKIAHNIPDRKVEMSMKDFIFSQTGDTRTSTFVFDSKSFKNILFDEKQNKHQDWDLAIRFEEVYDLTQNKQKTVILHNDTTNRMSSELNHEATDYLLRKHEHSTKPINMINFYISLISLTLKFEGRTPNFYLYKKRLNRIIKKNGLSLTFKQYRKLLLYKYAPITLLKMRSYIVKKMKQLFLKLRPRSNQR